MELAQVNERANHSNIGTAEESFWRKGSKLPRRKQAHKKSFNGVVEVVGVGDFICADLISDTINGGASEVCAGKAGTFIGGLNGGKNIDVVNLVRNF